MKKLKFLLLLSLSFIFVSCFFFDDDDSSGSSDSIQITTLSFPADSDGINLPSEYNGKECYIIYSNETSSPVIKGTGNAQFSINDYSETVINRSASNETEWVINKNAVKFNDGFYRDEIRFNTPYFKEQINSRAAGSSNYYNNHTPDGNNKSYFYVMSSGNQSVSLQQFELKEVGSHCRIWVLNNASSIFNANTLNFSSIRTAVDSVFTKETSVFGSNQISGGTYGITTNSNTKLDVLIYDIFGDASTSQNGGTFGFFRPMDIYQNSYVTSQGYSANSNECEVIHIDSYFLKLDLDGYNSNGTIIQTHRVESTLVHEFQHLLNYCNKNYATTTWYTEMLSMCAEDVFQSQINLSDDDSPKSRFNIHFDKPYNGFKTWPENDDENVYYAYANAYAFGAYLMRNYGGVNLIHQIATNAYVDEQSITEALHSQGYNEDFSSVFKKFGLTYINTETSGSGSLNKKITQSFNDTAYILDSIDLKNYYMSQYSSQLSMNAEALFLYRPDNYDKNPYGDNQGRCYLKGPKIYKTSYVQPIIIKPYGFVVYYVGKVQEGTRLRSNNSNPNITMTIVIK